MAQWPGSDTGSPVTRWLVRPAGTEAGTGTAPGTEAGTGGSTAAGIGTGALAVPAADDTPLPLRERAAARYNDLPGWAQDLLWPFIRLAHGVYTSRPDSMATYHRYIADREWVHPLLDGWRRKVATGAGITYHVLIGQWITSLGLTLAYAGPRPLRFLGLAAFLIPFLIVFAVFVRLV